MGIARVAGDDYETLSGVTRSEHAEAGAKPRSGNRGGPFAFGTSANVRRNYANYVKPALSSWALKEYASAIPQETLRLFNLRRRICLQLPDPNQFRPIPLKLTQKHYKIELENDRVRVLRITYGPREKSVMHAHPDGLAVFLTESRGRFTFPDGKSEDRSWTAGQTMFIPAETHLPENLTDQPLEAVLIELK